MALIQKIDLTVSELRPMLIIDAVAGDTNRTLECRIADWDIPEGATAKFVCAPSGLPIDDFDDCTINSSTNTVSIPIPEYALSIRGVTACQIQFTVSGKTITTFTFVIKVNPSRRS